MTYLRKHNRVSTVGRLAVFTAAFLVIVVALIIFLAPNFFPALFTSIARPFWRAEFSMSSGSMSSNSLLMSENEDLKRQLEAWQVLSSTTSALLAENTELKSLLGRSQSGSNILAAVLKRPSLSPYDELLVDVGADHGLVEGNAVYASGSLLIGRVSQVLGETSKVALFSSPGNKIDALIGDEHIQATIIGRGGGQYAVEVPRGLDIKEGDVVVAPSIDSPVLGTVISVISDSASAFREILIGSPINIYGIRWVLVSKPYSVKASE